MKSYENMVPKKAQICYFVVAHRYISDATPPGGSTNTVLLYICHDQLHYISAVLGMAAQ